MKLITAGDLAGALRPTDAIAALRAALLEGFEPADDLERTATALERGQMLFMPSQSSRYVGVKVLTVTPGNDGVRHPRIQGSYLLSDAEHHRPLAVIAGAALTTARTPAVSVAGVADALRDRARGGAHLLVFGVGPQGLAHVDAVAAVVPVARVTVAVRAAGREEDFLAGLAERGMPGAAVLPEDVPHVVPAADVIVTATTSPDPLFDGALVAAHAVVVAVGSHTREARELDPALLARSTVVVESRHSAMAEAGDVVLALAEGALAEDSLVTMAEAVREPGRLAPGRPVVFKTTGMPWEDLVVAGAAYERLTS